MFALWQNFHVMPQNTAPLSENTCRSCSVGLTKKLVLKQMGVARWSSGWSCHLKGQKFTSLLSAHSWVLSLYTGFLPLIKSVHLKFIGNSSVMKCE